MTAFKSARAVSGYKNPHHWTAEGVRLMVAACREMAVFHAKRSPELAALYKRRRFDPRTILKEGDLARIPMLGVSAMKRYLLTSLPHSHAVLKLTSSGTRGQKTQIWFDQDSLDRAQSMLTAQWEGEGLVSSEPTNYLMFVYDPKDAKDLGIAFSDENQQRFAPAARVFYAVSKNAAGAWEFQAREVLRVLEEYVRDGRPARLFGIPSFVHETLRAMARPVKLPAGSWMVTGGGWKAAEDKKITREDFRRKASEMFGLPLENIRDGYGMAEHSAPYMECAKHRFHVPVYNRVIARDPVTLAPLPPGRAGLLELITPYNAMMPNLALLSTDLGMIDAQRCPCGYRSPTFTLLGRAGLSKHKGCALHANEIVKRN